VTVATPTDTRPLANRPARERFAGLDGLRAVGIIAVFLTHNAFATGTTNGGRFTAQVGPISGRSVLGYLEVGATIFFVISAFLLYRPFVTAAFNDTPAPSITRFLRRRFVRIFPAYWVTLALLFALGWIHTATPLHTIRVITLTHVYTQQGFYAIDILVPMWTLAAEVAFYVFLVLWAPCMRRIGLGCEPRVRLRRELVGATALAAFAFVFRWCVYHGVAGLPNVAEHWLPGTLDLFAVGMAFAAIDAYTRTQRGRGPGLSPVLADLCGLIGMLWFIAVTFTHASSSGYSTGWDAYGRDVFQLLCASFLLAPAAFVGNPGGVYRRFLSWRPLVYIGLVSYGIYLWHDAWIVRAVHWSGGRVALQAPFWTVGVSAFSLSVVMGALSWHLLERPLLEFDAGRRRLSSRTASVPAPQPVGAAR
jgi:peptidoglycan/LPS O-acetylase OafA/YrhL